MLKLAALAQTCQVAAHSLLMLALLALVGLCLTYTGYIAHTHSVLRPCSVCMHAGSHGYIRVNNGVFVDNNCNEFTFGGYNTWEAVESAVNVCCGGYDALAGQFLAAGG